eukprot:gene39505-48814_t
MSDSPTKPTAKHIEPAEPDEPSPWDSAEDPSRLPFGKFGKLTPIVCGMVFGLLLRLAFSGAPSSRWSAMVGAFIWLVPLATGAITVYLAERQQRRSWSYYAWAPALATALVVLGSLLILIEGLICAIVIVPLFTFMGMAGGLCMGLVCRLTRWPRHAAYGFAVLPLAAALVMPQGAPNQMGQVERSLWINAPAAVVWEGITNIRNIQPHEVDTAWTSRIGVPPPVEAVTVQDKQNNDNFAAQLVESKQQCDQHSTALLAVKDESIAKQQRLVAQAVELTDARQQCDHNKKLSDSLAAQLTESQLRWDNHSAARRRIEADAVRDERKNCSLSAQLTEAKRKCELLEVELAETRIMESVTFKDKQFNDKLATQLVASERQCACLTAQLNETKHQCDQLSGTLLVMKAESTENEQLSANYAAQLFEANKQCYQLTTETRRLDAALSVMVKDKPAITVTTAKNPQHSQWHSVTTSKPVIPNPVSSVVPPSPPAYVP